MNDSAPAAPRPVSVLMVCLGNICRSPMAEAVMRDLVAQSGLTDRIAVDSAGTGDWHIGEHAHQGTRDELDRHGIDHTDIRSRQVTPHDMEHFDHIVAMDRSNFANLAVLAAPLDAADKITMLLDHAEDPAVRAVHEVPDPYYVGGFDRVHELVDAGCRGLLADIVREHDLRLT